MPMEFKVKQDNYNALLKRKEVSIEVDHEESGTPSRLELKKAVAAKYETKPENVYVVDIETKTGTQRAICALQVYDDPKTAASVVPKHMKLRDLPSNERKTMREQKAKKEEKIKQEKGKEEKPKQEGKPQQDSSKQSKEGAAQ